MFALKLSRNEQHVVTVCL